MTRKTEDKQMVRVPSQKRITFCTGFQDLKTAYEESKTFLEYGLKYDGNIKITVVIDFEQTKST